MKKYIIIVSILVCLFLALDFAYYHMGIYIDLPNSGPTAVFTKTENKEILIDRGNGYEEFEIRGVNMGSGMPGEWATDFAVDKETYKRWFRQICEMGANTVRVYTVQSDDFYNAFYEYNKDNADPLYLLHGVWVNDYIQNSHRDAYSSEFYNTFLKDCRTVVDVIHGKRKISSGSMEGAGSGTYKRDISRWVIGYILGVEWDDVTVSYTDDKYANVDGYRGYSGKYMYTSPEASVFETLLAKVGDSIIEYETGRYNSQRLIAFSNWPTTDPFTYPEEVAEFFMKCADVNVENILTTEEFKAGHFASYHVYPYNPDYLTYCEDWSFTGLSGKEEFLDEGGQLNTYRAYLTMLTEHHSIPVIISEFGVSTGRGMAHVDLNTGRNQGNMSEKEQGQALVGCWNDIIAADCAGGCVFSWQDEWFKRTWNTMHAVDLTRTPYWSDYQTNEQYFGLLSFDPGENESVSYVDGDISEWTDSDKIIENGDVELSVKYDEKFMYFLIKKSGLDLNEDSLYIPIDVTPKSGSNYCENFNIKFEREADFVLIIDGTDNSRLTVQERYDALRSTYSQNVYNFDTYQKKNIPEKNSPLFVNIQMILETVDFAKTGLTDAAQGTAFETGKLRYGNANPRSEAFDSLADFISSGEYIEIKLPWQLLNFADPSTLKIHDDYYDGNYGIEYIHVDDIYAGVGSGTDRITMGKIKLTGWDNDVTFHERLKSSYYVMQELWREDTK